MSHPDDPKPEHKCLNCKYYVAGAEPDYDGNCHAIILKLCNR